MNHLDGEDLGESFALRLLIHFIGDLHQPCHGVTRVNREFPSGDRGCNSVKLPSIQGVGNLHFLWDSAIYEFAGR